jgi:ABC-type uncharacterized transport system permease subunit
MMTGGDGASAFWAALRAAISCRFLAATIPMMMAALICFTSPILSFYYFSDEWLSHPESLRNVSERMSLIMTASSCFSIMMKTGAWLRDGDAI